MQQIFFPVSWSLCIEQRRRRQISCLLFIFFFPAFFLSFQTLYGWPPRSRYRFTVERHVMSARAALRAVQFICLLLLLNRCLAITYGQRISGVFEGNFLAELRKDTRQPSTHRNGWTELLK